MKIFVADNNSTIRDICRKYDIGILSSPSYFRFPPDYLDYILDNGAFIAWNRGSEWDETLFYGVVKRLCDSGIDPYFVVVPDIVCGGIRSLDRSKQHINKLPTKWKKYLPVQDGITPDLIDCNGLDGIFIGGSLRWKWRTAKAWCDFAHDNYIKCHIGRVGTIRGYRKAYACGADSVDGSGPSRNNRMDIPIKYLEEVMVEQQNLF